MSEGIIAMNSTREALDVTRGSLGKGWAWAAWERDRVEEPQRLQLLAAAAVEREVGRGQRDRHRLGRLEARRAVELRRRQEASEPDRRESHRRRRGREPQPGMAPQAPDDRHLEVLARGGPKRGRQPLEIRAEGAAGRAALEMGGEQGVLERRQLAVDVGRRPLAGAITVAVHRAHISSDGGSVQKLAHMKAA
jgi:hypothetical protein